jgi:predicted component of type VI protein secretion system
MNPSTVIIEDEDTDTSSAAVLTLTRGASGFGSWSFDRRDAGKKITVGSTRGCDWQVVSSGVAPMVLYFSGDALWAGVEQTNRHVNNNGATLSRGWSRLEHGDHLELGGARIKVALAPELRTQRAHSAIDARPARDLTETLADAPNTVTVRLLRGESERSSWTFRESDLGVSVTLGAAESCDWRVATGGLEARELTLLSAGTTLLIRQEHISGRVKLDGKPLGEEWAFVRDGSRIEIGLACLELRIGPETPTLPPMPPALRVSRHTLPERPGAVQRERTLAPQASEPARPSHRPPPFFAHDSLPASVTPPARPVATQTAPLVAMWPTTLPAAPSHPAPVTRPVPSHAMRRSDPWLQRANVVKQQHAAVERHEEPAPMALHQEPILVLEAERRRPKRKPEGGSFGMGARSHPSQEWVEACMPEVRHEKKMALGTYALLGLLISVLYAAWLIVLERF